MDQCTHATDRAIMPSFTYWIENIRNNSGSKNAFNRTNNSVLEFRVIKCDDNKAVVIVLNLS